MRFGMVCKPEKNVTLENIAPPKYLGNMVHISYKYLSPSQVNMAW